MQQINLQVYPRGVNPIIQISQYDKGRQLQLNLYDGASKYNIPAGSEVLFEGQKPDETIFSYEAAYAGNVVTITIAQQATLIPGRTTCELRILNGDSVNIGTINFTMYVEASPVNGDYPVSETDIPAIIELGQQYAQRAEDASERAEADAEIATSAANRAEIVAETIPNDYSNLGREVRFLEFFSTLKAYKEYDGYLKSDGTFFSSADNHCKFVDFYVNDFSDRKIYYKGVGRTAAYSAVFFDENDTVVSSLQYESPSNYAEITVPSGAYWVRMSSFAAVNSDVVLDIYFENDISVKLKNIEDTIDSEVESISDTIDSKEINQNNKRRYLEIFSTLKKFLEHTGYLGSNGVFDNNADYHCKYVDFYVNDFSDRKIYYKGVGRSAAYSAIFFDENDTIVSALQYESPSDYAEITIPSGAYWVRMSSFAAVNLDVVLDIYFENDISVKIKNIEDTIDSEVESISDTIDSKEIIQNNKRRYLEIFSTLKKFLEHTGYLKSNASFENNADYHCKYVDFYVNDFSDRKIYYKGVGRSAAYSAIFFDENDTIVSALQYESPSDYAEITIPSGAYWVRMSSFSAVNLDVVFDIYFENDISVKLKALEEQIIDIEPAVDILKNKKWAVCGDSFTNGDHIATLLSGKYAGKNANYAYLIGNRVDINVLDFFANGRTLAFPANPGDFTNSLTNPNIAEYYQNIPADVDIITIYLGINDGHHADGDPGTDEEPTEGYIGLGTINDADTSTYYGAWNMVMTWLLMNRPFAHIGIIVSNGVNDNSWRQAQIQIANKYGVPYLDLNGDARCRAMIRSVNPDIPSAIKNIIKNNQAVDPDGTITGSINTHPNENAHLLESYFIENWLRSL